MTPMDTPTTRAEFEERMNYALENLSNGRMKFASGLRVPASLLQVRPLPNGRTDFLSIDEMARVNANTTYQWRNADFGKLSPGKGER